MMVDQSVGYSPAFFKWSSIITDDIIKTFPILPTTAKHASTSNRAMDDHSVDNVTGEKSFIWCLLLLLALLRLCNVRCDMDVTKNGIVNVVVVVGIAVGVTIDIVAVVAASKLLMLWFIKSAAIVDTSIFARYWNWKRDRNWH